jgi:hypothetical protein
MLKVLSTSTIGLNAMGETWFFSKTADIGVNIQTVFTIGVGYDFDPNNAEMFPKCKSAVEAVAA